MNLIVRYKNYRFLKKALREDMKMNWDYFTRSCFKTLRKFKKNGCDRNLATTVIKKYRSKYPYWVKGWTDNQKLYEEYFTLPGAIKSLEEVKEKLNEGDVYVTMFREFSVYKGEKLFQYSQVSTFLKQPVVYKLIDYKKKYNSFRIVDNGLITLDDEWMTAFRYSTEEEIAEYKLEIARQKEIQQKINLKQKEISELYNEKNRKNNT